jgi:hypothetical protein
MANKSVYQDFDTDALNHYGLAAAPKLGVVVGSIVEDVLVTQDQTTFEKIQRSLSVSTESGTTFINKKKAFILPRCDVSQDRLKAALKEHGITVTSDYTLADLIVGHKDLYRRFANGENIMSSIMMSKLWNYETTSGAGGSSLPLNTIIENHGKVIVTHRITEKIRYYDLNIETSLYDEWLITGLALNLAYLIDTTGGDISVIDPETILHSSANKVVMDEELLSDLSRQLQAYGDDNKAMAAKMIPCIDYTKNFHLLWRFAQDNDGNMYSFKRDKDIQYWLSVSNFNKFTRLSAQDMILWLEKKEYLNTVSFRYLEPIVRREISIFNRDLYTFKVAVKKEYQQYLGTKI